MRIDFLHKGCKEMVLNECKYIESALDIEFPVKSEDAGLLGDGGRVCVNFFFYSSNPFQIVYERAFSAEKAFEICLMWYMAGSRIVGEMVSRWRNEAAKHQFNLFPIPDDAIAKPKDVSSNPLRCPVRIHIKQDVIPEEKVLIVCLEIILFQLENTLLQLLFSFGFVPMACHIEHPDPDHPRSSSPNSISQRYKPNCKVLSVHIRISSRDTNSHGNTYRSLSSNAYGRQKS